MNQTWFMFSLAWFGIGMVMDEIFNQIETGTFVGNHNVSLNGGIGLVCFAVAIFWYAAYALDVLGNRSKRE